MQYNILDHVCVLTQSKGSKTKYHCPVCNGDDLDIKPSTGQYQCFSGGCSPVDIRAAIDRLEGKPEYDPRSKNEPSHWKKPTRPAATTTYYYPDRQGNDLIKVMRIDPGDGGKKNFKQSHWNGSKWLATNPPEIKVQIPIYRYADVLQAILGGSQVWIVEGENAVNRLWDLGIPATTTIGGSGGFASYGDYVRDLKSGSFILAPDCDAKGIEYIGKFATILGDRVAGYYLAGNESNWSNPCGGFDVVDDIATGMDKSAILGKVIDPARYLVAIAGKPKQPVGRPKGKTSKASNSSKDTEKGLDALSMAAEVSRDVFTNRIKYDALAGQYWRYNGAGLWVTEIPSYVFGLVQVYIQELGVLPTFTPNYVRNVMEFAKKDYEIAGWQDPSTTKFMPFTNGVLNLATMELLPHCHSYGFRWQLPREYSSMQGSWANIDKFLTEMSSGNSDLKYVLIAFCNMVLISRPELQKFLYLFGSGGNGKGVLTRLLSGLVGAENTCTVDIGRLNDNSFESARMENKRLALVPDTDRSKSGVSVFRSATGQDAIRSERKGKDAHDFVFYGTFVISANKPSFAGDSDDAIFRRKIHFPCNFKPKTPDPTLDSKLQAELPAFTTYLMSLTSEWVCMAIGKASNIKAIKDQSLEIMARENNIMAFILERLVPDARSCVGVATLYESYLEYCDSSSMKPCSIVNFRPELVSSCVNTLSMAVSDKKTKTVRLVYGIRLRMKDEDFFDPTAS